MSQQALHESCALRAFHVSEFQSFRLSGVFDCLGIFIYGVAQAAARLEISRVPITASLVCRNQLTFI